MLKGAYEKTKGTVKYFFNIPAWIGSENVTDSGRWVLDLWNRLTHVSKSERQETFEEALERLGLTEEEIQERYKVFNRMAWLMVFMFFLGAVYTIYLAKTASLTILLASFGILVFLFALFMRYSFWAYQIKERRLGSSFSDWMRGLWGN